MMSGWIIAPENPKQLAKTIKYVLDHPAEAKEKGKKARGKWKREYGWDAVEKCLVEFLLSRDICDQIIHFSERVSVKEDVA